MSSIDIIIPSYNYARYLRDCVGSVQAQDVDYRILIVDNASTDDSVAVAHELAAADPRITVVARSVNLGLHASLNEGVDWAVSPYQTLLCADDILAPGSLAMAIAVLDADPRLVMALGEEQPFWGSELPKLTVADRSPAEWEIVPGRTFIDRHARLPAQHWNAAGVVVRTSAQRAIGHWRKEVEYGPDREIGLRLATVGDVAITKTVLSYVRYHHGNYSAPLRDLPTLLGHVDIAWRSFLANEGARVEQSKELAASYARNLAATAYWWGVRALATARPGTASKLFQFAYRTRPASVVVPPLHYILREDGPVRNLFRQRA